MLAKDMARKPFRFQYSLKALLVVMFVLGPVCGTYVYAVRQRPKDAHQAIAKLRSKGCDIKFKLQDAADMDFMSKWLGAEPMPVHCEVDMNEQECSDGDMALLGTLTDFDVLHLDGIQVSNSGWSQLRRVKRIHRLLLHETHFSDEGLGYLSAVEGINELWLNETSVTDRGAAILGLRTDVTYLYLQRTKITDEGLKDIGKMKQLVRLELDDCEITDDGIVHLATLGNLRHLSLKRTKLTDRGLVHFIPMQKLGVVDIHGCDVTVVAARRLFDARPENPIGLYGDQKE